MLAQSFQFAEILIIAYLHFHFGSASSVGSNAIDHAADSSYYLCAGNPFSQRAIEVNRQLACEKLHNVDPNGSFPAQLEDNRQFEGAPDALVVWPIIDENTVYKTAVPGKMRIVIDLDCNLAGLIIRHENTFERCMKLSRNHEVDSNGPDLDTYTGYNCSNTFFSSTYVEKSIAKALDLFKSRLSAIYCEKYPKTVYCRSAKQRIFSWPLLADHTLYNSGVTSLISRMYYVEFSENRAFTRVVSRYDGRKICPEINAIILPEANARPRAHTHHENEGRKQRAVCMGQNFSSSYIRLNKEKAIRAYAQLYANVRRNYRYPRHPFYNSRKRPNHEWIWPLRHVEKALRSKVISTFHNDLCLLCRNQP
ncbi:unnamed protein product [Blumeria hordei]|uniref:Uncharacterized protein n=1 Tax=Blumeria hordei TaxID=2867405 RepID=A0A383UIS6_BLUHO|nr:unnamed protein product [Blumeria hordei]